jgi:branched-chain amino acid transport system ATP-binding protein
VRDLHVYYGGIHALKGVSFDIYAGEIVTLIGANGAGKTTTLNTISGLIRPRQGSVLHEGQEITTLPPHKIVARGICQSPEGRKIFANMSVRENLDLGAYLRKDRAAIKKDLDYVIGLFPRLGERLRQSAGTLSGGEQQMLAIARALMGSPKVLLLDEPSLGLSPILVQTIFRAIGEINHTGTTILLVEQNAHQALRLAKRGYVMETGRIVVADETAKLAANPEIKKAYLGA